jgi:hypothetical protein
MVVFIALRCSTSQLALWHNTRIFLVPNCTLMMCHD